jgi:predicted dehydrogenase
MTKRIAVIGGGFFSQFHYDAWARLDVDVVGVCDLDISVAQTIASAYSNCVAYDDLGLMLSEQSPDLLDIVTPPTSHLEIIKRALDAGVSVICQKPFCGGFDGAREAAKLMDASGIPIVVHENFRFQPWYGEIKSRLDTGALGDVYEGTFRLRPGDGQGPDAYLARQPYFQQMPRFLVHETLVHIIDVFRYLFGDVASVYADLRQLNSVIAGEDAGVIVMTFVDGRRAVIDGNRLVDHIAENRRLVMGDMWIEGSDGVIRLNGDGGLFMRAHDRNTETELAYDWQNVGFGGDCVYRLNKHVLECLADGTQPMNTATAYLENLRIVEAVYQSDDAGARVDL